MHFKKQASAMYRYFPTIAFSLALCSCLAAAAQSDAQQDIRSSVVRVLVSQRYPNLMRPWLKQNPQQIWGSGVLVAGNRVLTNAHLVMYASQIDVQPFNAAQKFSTKIVNMAPDVDLALLRVNDPNFHLNRAKVELAPDLPKINDQIVVYGYPVGGQSVRATSGVASRIEFAPYLYHGTGLRIEINAPIAPGNSGGPALHNGRLIGLVYSVSADLPNVGYVVPNEEIRTFLSDVADGRYEGKPNLWLDVQGLENSALRNKLQLPAEVTGVLVHSDHPHLTDYPLRAGDVITKIGEMTIDNIGMANIEERNLRLAFPYLVSRFQRNAKVNLTVFRDGDLQRIEVPAKRQGESLIKYLQGGYPSYFVWGPLAFTSASGELADLLNSVVPNFTDINILPQVVGIPRFLCLWFCRLRNCFELSV